MMGETNMQRVNNDSRSRSRAGRRWGWAFMAALVATTTGCGSLLDVENPNNVVQEDLENASSVNAMVNGAHALVSDAVSDVTVSTADLSDEFVHTGSQNWAAELDVGSITNVEGRSNALFNSLSEARWMADEAIATAEQFSSELVVKTDLAQAYLASGIAYMTIADNFEDFTFSNRTEVGPPVGEGNMQSVYDIAMERFMAAEAEAASRGASDLVLAAKAFQARTAWAKALWPKLNPPGSAPADPLVNNSQANALAAEVVGSLSGDEADWSYDYLYSSGTLENSMAGWVNSRQEFAFSPLWVQLDAAGRKVVAVTYQDPVDGVTDPALEESITSFIDGYVYSPLTILSAREMHLILAEAALASGDESGAITHINHVRALKGSSEWDGTGPSVLDMLKHERLVNLFLQPTRRLWDLYRFDVEAPNWAPGSDATRNGQVFIIGQDEVVSNCYILGTC